MGTNIRPEVSENNKYWISRHRYYELKHFCLQYPEWKKSYISLDGLPMRSLCTADSARSNGVGKPTEMYAEARIYYKDRMEMVEKLAEKAAGDLAGLLLKAVTEGLSFEKIGPPCCKEVWYAAYRRFFWLLDKARK
ncbi:MAG: hypothetical protein IKN04_02220 [Clostridia bacterium]|nr:hypothetical protein [Clostridia bacterium]MBR6185626.1 hypothetical protein [Clostridia bacterium]